MMKIQLFYEYPQMMKKRTKKIKLLFLILIFKKYQHLLV